MVAAVVDHGSEVPAQEANQAAGRGAPGQAKPKPFASHMTATGAFVDHFLVAAS